MFLVAPRPGSSNNESVKPPFQENLWGYGKRLRFLDMALQRHFVGLNRSELKILDVGCGNGSQLAIPLAKNGYCVTAIDPHLPSIEHGRSLSSAVNFVHGNLSDFPLSGFDCVILSEVLEHLTRPEELLRVAVGYLSPSGLVFVTVPNGYGEFELDRRLYQVLRMDRLVAWLRSAFKRRKSGTQSAGTDEESPHLQRFTRHGLTRMFFANRLLLVEARPTSFVSGPMVAHSFGKSALFVRLNAALADYLPMSFASGWMFCLRRERSSCS